MHLDWQTVCVIAIELLAVGFLVRKFLLPPAPKPNRRPDVSASSLVRKKR